MLRVVLDDPNVLVSALISPAGVPARVIEAVLDGDIDHVASLRWLSEADGLASALTSRAGSLSRRSRPGLGEVAKRDKIDLCVDRGRCQISVTQHLTDLDQACAQAQHLAGQGMTKPVGARQVRNTWRAPTRGRPSPR